MNSEKIYTNSFFFDSYAFFEILRGSNGYGSYKKCGIVTTKLNIFELYLGLLRDVNEKTAEENLNKYYPFVVDYDEQIIKDAAGLKHKLNKRDVSMTDCIGYILAKRLRIKFLTGDKQFENMENVEFVK